MNPYEAREYRRANPAPEKRDANARPRRLWVAFVVCLALSAYIPAVAWLEASNMYEEKKFIVDENIPFPWDEFLFFGVPLPLFLLVGITLVLCRKPLGLWVLVFPASLPLLPPIGLMFFETSSKPPSIGTILLGMAVFAIPSLPFWIVLSVRRWLYGQRS